tara:strand:+ start:287 stop:481 length:195 start_codon:yes stop_codon:yes gene_type:complete
MAKNYVGDMESLTYDLKVKVEELEDLMRRGLTNGMEITEDQYVNFHEAVGPVFEVVDELERDTW